MRPAVKAAPCESAALAMYRTDYGRFPDSYFSNEMKLSAEIVARFFSRCLFVSLCLSLYLSVSL
jgi:hypothetical protein